MSEQLVESVEQIDQSGVEWRIDILEDTMLLYNPNVEYPVVEIYTTRFDVFYQLRNVIKTSSTEEIWNFINSELETTTEKKLKMPKPPPGLMFYN